MKIPYSEYRVHPDSRKLISKVGYYKAMELVREIDKANIVAKRDVALAALEMWYLHGVANHIFVPKSLYEFLSNRGYDTPMDGPSVELLFGIKQFPVNKDVTVPVVCVHVEGGESPTCLCCPTLSPTDNVTGLCVVAQPSDMILVDNNVSSKDQTVEGRMWAFLRGASLYLSCFDGVLKTGVPDNLKHAPRFNEKMCKHLLIHSDVMDDKSAITPHFRNGHFRLLTSEKFTHKKGQVVFVRECFVKGHAVTLIPNIGAAK